MNIVKGNELAKKKKPDEGVQDLDQGTQFTDLIYKPLGSVPCIMYWSDQQMELNNNIRHMKHTLLIGDYGTGQL